MKSQNAVKYMFVAGMLCLAGVMAQAQPGDGINVNGWKLSPSVNLSATYDSNVYSMPRNTVDDTYFRTGVGLDVSYEASMFQLQGLGFFDGVTYSSEDNLNYTVGGENVTARLGKRDQFQVSLGESFRRVEDIDGYSLEGVSVGGISSDSVLDSSTRSRRDVTQATVGLGKNITQKLDMDLGYRYDAVAYDSSELYDLNGQSALAEAGLKMTDKTAGTLAAVYGTQHSQGSSDDPDYIAARLGLKTVGTDKIVFKGGVGALFYNRTATDGSDSDKNLVNYDLTATWRATDKVMVTAGGRNGIQLSSIYADNPAEFNMVWLDGACQVVSSTMLSAGVSYRQDSYLDQVVIDDVSKDRVDKGFSGRLRMDYTPPGLRFADLFCEALYESVDSTVGDYNDSRFSVGAKLHY
jgi:hypothetical protein